MNRRDDGEGEDGSPQLLQSDRCDRATRAQQAVLELAVKVETLENVVAELRKVVALHVPELRTRAAA